jgi:hypothetical protein
MAARKKKPMKPTERDAMYLCNLSRCELSEELALFREQLTQLSYAESVDAGSCPRDPEHATSCRRRSRAAAKAAKAVLDLEIA